MFSTYIPKYESQVVMDAEEVQVAKPAFQILVVEDDPDLRRLYWENMRNWSMRPVVIVVEDGREALIHLRHSTPDLIVLDLAMPHVDGFKALQQFPLRSKIVVVTGMDHHKIQRLGGIPAEIEVLQKPIPFTALYLIAQRVACTAEM
ncbi:MAG: response regulator [Actinomycetota bacterium]